DLLSIAPRQRRALRGNRIAMILQDPKYSLDPVMSIGRQIVETLRTHERVSKAEARERALAMLEAVQIRDPKRVFDLHPHEVSGGMGQRAMIAMALACSPELLIADEPTTALDVTIQAQILRLIVDLKERTGTAVMFITHDLGVVAETCQRVIVMYAGRIVEQANVIDLFARPAHPYTQGLMRSVPDRRRGRQRRLPEIAGIVPS
ncbi:MAG: ABC transporter ATP-binding protein, partial [Mesorhizobium sp.]